MLMQHLKSQHFSQQRIPKMRFFTSVVISTKIYLHQLSDTWLEIPSLGVQCLKIAAGLYHRKVMEGTIHCTSRQSDWRWKITGKIFLIEKGFSMFLCFWLNLLLAQPVKCWILCDVSKENWLMNFVSELIIMIKCVCSIHQAFWALFSLDKV
jgi:hypothetical protein